jgi:hypothetical protein
MGELRYLSASSLKAFLTCPFQGKLAYGDRLRPAVPKAVLAFGTAVHTSIETYYLEGTSPELVFKKIWEQEQETGFAYSNGDTHASLLASGQKLMRVFPGHLERPGNPDTLEISRYCEVGGEVPFWGTIDFTGDGGALLMDWKTSASRYPEHRVKMDLQLTAYSYLLAVNGRMPDRVGFGVFVKKKDPEIQFLSGQRTRQHLREFEDLVLKVWRDIHEGHFHKIPGGHCGWCDFAPICMGEALAEPDGVRFIKAPERYAAREEQD